MEGLHSLRKHTKPIDKVVFHNTQTEVVPMDKAVERLRYLHVEKRGWDEIGYHYVIHPLTGEVRNTRPVEFMGAHAKGANSGSIGVAILGDWREERVPPVAVIAAYELFQDLHHRGFFDPNSSSWAGEFTHATCPGCTTKTDCGAEGTGIWELVEAIKNA